MIEASIEKSGFWFWTWDIITRQGATTKSIDIYRNGALLVTTPSDGSYSTALTGGTSYAYQVCESGSSVNCSQVIE